MNITPGIVWTSTTPVTAANLNLTAQPTGTVGTNELTLSNFPTASANNTWIARYTTGSGNYEALVTTTTGLGYYTGAGGTVTQQTNKSTAVQIDVMCGTITMNNAALNAGVTVGFTVTNNKVVATDIPLVVIKSGATADSYRLQVDAVAAGSFRIAVTNITGGNLSEAIVLSFALFKAVAA
jgi:hypothetical protein